MNPLKCFFVIWIIKRMVQKDDSEEQLKNNDLRIRHHHFVGTVSYSHKDILWLQAIWNIEHEHIVMVK